MGVSGPRSLWKAGLFFRRGAFKVRRHLKFPFFKVKLPGDFNLKRLRRSRIIKFQFPGDSLLLS
jgi:hypothetical protein